MAWDYAIGGLGAYTGNAYGQTPTPSGPLEADAAPIGVSQAVTLTQNDHRVFELSASSIAALVDLVRVTYVENVTDTLVPVDATTFDKVLPVAQALAISANAPFNAEWMRAVLQTLSIAQAATIFNTTQRQQLNIVQVVRFVWPFAVAQSLSMADEVRVVHSVAVADILTFLETIGINVSKPIAQQLDIVQVVGLNGIWLRNVVQTLTIAQGVWRVPTGHWVPCASEYRPAVALGSRDDVVLTWPYASPSLTLHLRCPKFGNIETLDTRTKFHRTRSGQLNPVRGASWPDVKTLSVSFEGLSQQKVDDLKVFITSSAALEVGYLDHENRQWHGVILTETVSIVPDGRGCDYQVALQLRGSLA